MTLNEITTAVDNGLIVHWSNDGYTVKRGKNGDYCICHAGGNCIGLTWADGETLNGNESDFYIEG